jgi:hypothetical protein
MEMTIHKGALSISSLAWVRQIDWALKELLNCQMTFCHSGEPGPIRFTAWPVLAADGGLRQETRAAAWRLGCFKVPNKTVRANTREAPALVRDCSKRNLDHDRRSAHHEAALR